MSAREVAERLAKRRAWVQVPTPEGPQYVRGLNGREREEYLGWLRDDDPNSQILLSDQKLLTRVLGDGNGSPMFAEDQAGQAAGLLIVQEWLIEDVMPLAKKSLAMSGIGKAAEDEAVKK